MVDKACGIFTTENIIIFFLVIVLLALIFRYIQLKTNEKYTNTEGEQFSNNPDTSEGFMNGESICTLYYANWCPHCKSLYPFFNEWRDSNEGKLILDNDKVVMIRSYEENDIPESEASNIEGFPTIKLTFKHNSKEYMGSRTKEDILSWLASNIQ